MSVHALNQPVRDIHDNNGDTDRFLEACTSCGACISACDLLRSSGAPDAVIRSGKAEVFLCTNCGACSAACPSGLDPADAMLQAKHRLLKAGQASSEITQAVNVARTFIDRSHMFLFSSYSRTETVFWPGCSLSALSPDAVRKTHRILRDRLGKQIGIALDCCSGPAYHLGDLDTVRNTADRIGKTFERNGITTVIAACMNCVKVLRDRIPGLKVEHVFEVYPDVTAGPFAGREFRLHHPCPAHRFDATAKRAEALLRQLGIRLSAQTPPRCCGFGGNINILHPMLAEERTNEVLAGDADMPLVTYCMSCKDRFLSKGRMTYHILELLASAEPVDRSVSSLRKWIARFSLAQESRLRDYRRQLFRQRSGNDGARLFY